jgi:hypothetical protein
MCIESKYKIYHQELSKQEEEQTAIKFFFPVSMRVQTRQCTYIRVILQSHVCSKLLNLHIKGKTHLTL